MDGWMEMEDDDDGDVSDKECDTFRGNPLRLFLGNNVL